MAASLMVLSSAAVADPRGQADSSVTAMVVDQCGPPRQTAPEEKAGLNKLMEPGASSAPPPLTGEQVAAAAELRARDWAGLCTYQAENAALTRHPRVVFMGDSITEFWKLGDPGMFGPDVVDRGIRAQTTSQMVARFYADVIALKPRVVHLMAGTNDIAGNTGPTTERMFRNNIMAMADMARFHGIKIVLGSILPASSFWWAPEWRPAARIVRLNDWLASYARENSLVYVDYYKALAAEGGALDPRFANDGVHPNRAGYAVMRPLALTAVGP